MLCQNCGVNPATLRTVIIAGGVKQELYLCEECAKKRGIPFNKMPVLIKLISGKGQREATPERVCPKCGSSLKSLKETGLLGCSECYNALRDELAPFIKRAQGGRENHVGQRIPPRFMRPKTQQTEELERMQQELQQALAVEEYERAAQLRDAIRALKARGGEG